MSNRSRKTPSLVAAILFTLLVGVSSFAQEDVDARGIRRGYNIIEGRIFYPSGRLVDKRLKITLQSVDVTDGFTFSNEHGEFVFRKLPGGTYRLNIDAGKEYELHSERVDVIDKARRRGDETETTWTVTIFLKPKVSPIGVNATVNAALAAVPRPALELYEKAAQASKNGDKQRAIEFLRQAVKEFPQFGEAYNELGFLYISMKDADKAVASFDEAVKIAPENFVYRLNLGYVLLEAGKLERARDELQKAVELNAASTRALLLLSRAQLGLKNFEVAEKNLLEIVKLNGADLGNAFKTLGSLYDEKGNFTKSSEYFEKYLALPANERDASTLIRLSRVQIKLRKLSDAEKNLLKALSFGGREVGMAHRFLGALYIEQGHLDRAIQHLEKYLELAPTAKDVEQIRALRDNLRKQTVN